MRIPGWLGAAISTDHKRIGLNLGAASLVYFLLGGGFALLMRSQLASPNGQLLSNNSYNELFTMHGSTMIYLFVTPMALAMAMYLVPLQIGAVTISAPRVALAGFWVWVSGGLVMQSGWFTSDGAGRDGWSAYAPLSNGTNTPGTGQDLWTLGVILAVLGMLLMAWCVALTILRRRAPGMSLLRMPVFTWTALVSVLMVIGAFPMLVVAMVLLYIDRHGGHIFTGFTGSIDYEDLFWFFGHPVVYVMFFPYLGSAAEAIAVSAHKRWFGYLAFVASMMAFAALSMSVWGHHMLVTGGVTNEYFAFTSTALVIPAGVEYFDLIGTLVGGSIVLRTSMLFALAFFISSYRRPDRGVHRLTAARLPGLRHVLHRGPFPLHAVCGQHLRVLRRRLSLVPQDHRRPAARGAWKGALRPASDRRQHDLPADVLRRRAGHAAVDLPVSGGPAVGDA